jgi:cytochrome d ubiquinol oxidase subunit II
MTDLLLSDPQILPLIFAFLMGLATLIYAVLDGYDIGVGLLTHDATEAERDTMIASIGPFWDANETWLVLAVGLLLVAFPMAQGMVLGALYLPVAFMLFGLILRGVAFDFRVKAPTIKKDMWNRAFFAGSLMMALTQGIMIGAYVLGFEGGFLPQLFAFVVGICVVAGYGLIGAAWLIMKTEGALQAKAVRWARRCLWGTGIGIVAVSMATPLASDRIFFKWFETPDVFYLIPLPLVTAGLIWGLDTFLSKPLDKIRTHCWVPFAATVGIYVLCFLGLGFSFYPYIVPDRLLIVDAASAPASLLFILVGTLIVLPLLIAYTAFAYRVFWGKTRELSYD